MNILVTGNLGYIGSVLVPLLQSQNHQVTGLDSGYFDECLLSPVDQNFKQIEQGLRREKLQSPNDTGIVITNDRIEVDLNKTENFVNKWMRSMEAVGKQLDGIAKELDKSFHP